MLGLDDPIWRRLRDAFGLAFQVPDMLRQLADAPPSDDWRAEPYFSLWSHLCHQGDVYPASFAALPHLVARCEADAAGTHWDVLHLAVAIENARLTKGMTVQEDFAQAYADAVGRLPQAASAMLLAQPSEPSLVGVAAAALATTRGHWFLSEVILEVESEENAREVLTWLRARATAC